MGLQDKPESVLAGEGDQKAWGREGRVLNSTWGQGCQQVGLGGGMNVNGAQWEAVVTSGGRDSKGTVGIGAVQEPGPICKGLLL